MFTEFILRAPVTLLPVLTFLAGLMLLDSFRLVRLSAVSGAMLAGGAIAGASYWLNGVLLDATDLRFLNYSRYVSPVVEESLKALAIVYLLRTRRVGMLVDGAIFGFAIGTGFVVVENLFYLANRLPVPAEVLVYTEAEWAAMEARGERFARVLRDESVWLLDRRRDLSGG